MKHRKLRWFLIVLSGLIAVTCSVGMISFKVIANSYQELNDMITASSRTLRQVLPEFNGSEQLYREVQDEMNTAVLHGFAYQLAQKEKISAEEFERKCQRYGVEGGFVETPDGQVICAAGEDVRERYEASLSEEDSSHKELFYSETLPDKRVLVLEFSGEDLEELIDYSVAWMNRVQKLRIGQTGFCCVLSQDGTIISHPEKRLTLEEETRFDIENTSFLIKGLSLFVLESQNARDSYNYSMIGKLIPFQGYNILCGVTLPEYLKTHFLAAMSFPLLLFLTLYVFFRYLLLLRRIPKKAVLHRLSVAGLIGLIFVFSSSLFLQAVNGRADQMSAVGNHAQNAVDALERNEEIRDYITIWFNFQQLNKCFIAADILYEEQNGLTRSDVQKISEMLGTTWCFLYDDSGHVVLTDSPYDHFVLSKIDGSQSSAFLPLLEGVEYVVQDPMPDDVSGDEMQYVGVSVRDENDLADGFVQIAVDRALYRKMIDALGIRQEIENIGVNQSESAFALNLESGIIDYATNPDLVGLAISKDAFENLDSSYNGYLNFNGTGYIAGIRQTDSYLISAMTPKNSLTPDMLRTSLILCGLLLAALAVYALLFPGSTGQEENSSQTRTPPEGSLKGILQRLLFMICLLLTLQYLFSAYHSQEYPHSGIALIEFIMNGNWQRELNLFSVAYSLFIAVFAAATFGLLSSLLNQLAKIGSPHVQTLCYLGKNILKYAFLLAVLYYCLAQFGVDSRTLLASAGIMSLVIGLGAKDLITDILAGLFIIFERTFEVGDFVTIDDFYGFVQEIGLRTTKVAFQSNVKIYNNSDIRKVVNRRGSRQRVIVELGMSLDESLEHAETVFNRELPALKDKIPGALEAPACRGVAEITDRVWKLRIILECEPSLQFAARAQLLRELKLIADQNGLCLAGKQYDILEIEGLEGEEIV